MIVVPDRMAAAGYVITFYVTGIVHLHRKGQHADQLYGPSMDGKDGSNNFARRTGGIRVLTQAVMMAVMMATCWTCLIKPVSSYTPKPPGTF